MLGTLALIIIVAYLFLAFFEPHQPYRTASIPRQKDSEAYWRMLQAVSDASLAQGNRIAVLPNGENFYAAELDAIANARKNINIEAYIWAKGELTQRFIAALAARARAGVQVRIVLDAVGSFATRISDFEPLTAAGGKVAFYHPLRWYNFDRYNNRTHRELIVVDGRLAFMGGAGFADHWLKAEQGRPRWRDTMARIEGPIVNALQGTFVENWVESSGELLVEADFYPPLEKVGEVPAFVVTSSAGRGKATRARMMFQALIAAANRTIYMSTPYFLPDVAARAELIEAAKRGVQIKIITPGMKSDHAVTRSSSRRLFGDLLANGIEIYEYQPAMIHAKILLIDGEWSVMGSTNFDNRSFELNDELNLTAFDGEMTRGLTEQFHADLQSSKRITLEQWQRRPLSERATEFLGRLLERQQ